MEPEGGAVDAAAPSPPVAADDLGDAGPGPGSSGELATTSRTGKQKEEASDVFDSPDFNVTTYVNRMFPTGEDMQPVQGLRLTLILTY